MLYTNALQCASQREKILSNSWGLYFHGTRASFTTFSESHIGAGPEAHCALGVFGSDNPRVAANHAQMLLEDESGVVLLVLLNETRSFQFTTYGQFLGRDAEHGPYEHGREHFVWLRQELAREHTAARFALDGDGLIGIALRTEYAVVIGHVDLQIARTLGRDPVFKGTRDPRDIAFKLQVLKRAEELVADRYRVSRAA